MARFHHYSFGNCMMIAMQRPDATHVAGFNRWKELGRFVKAGEKGIVIIAPMLFRKKASDGDPATTDEQDAEKLLRFKAVYVFDVNQTDGQPLPELHRVGGNPNGHTDRLKDFIAKNTIALEYSDDIGSADGVSKGGKIVIRPDLTPAEEFSVLCARIRPAGSRITGYMGAQAPRGSGPPRRRGVPRRLHRSRRHRPGQENAPIPQRGPPPPPHRTPHAPSGRSPYDKAPCEGRRLAPNYVLSYV
jgi:hypothetical protein